MSDNLALAQRVEQLEADTVIPLGSVDLTIVDPDRLRLEFDEIFHYFAVVEGSVPQNIVDIATLLPNLDEIDRRFLAAWSAQEAAHSTIFEAIRTELGLGTASPSLFPRPRASLRPIGTLANVDWLHDVLKHVYLTRGAMHEHLTYDAYVRLGHRLTALGELGIVRTVTDPIRRQEARHLGYYRTAATAQRRRLGPSQLRLARMISVRTYRPVGATRPRRALCGRVFADLAADDIELALEPLEAIANALLGEPHRPLPRFVHRAMSRCTAATSSAIGKE